MSDITSVFGNNIGDDGKAAGLPPIRMEPAVVRDAPVQPKQEAVVKEPRVRIILEDNENIPPTGQFFGADGVGYYLKSNIEADVPVSIISILDTSVMSVPVVDPNSMQITGYRDRLRFPYRVVKHIPAEV